MKFCINIPTIIYEILFISQHGDGVKPWVYI